MINTIDCVRSQLLGRHRRDEVTTSALLRDLVSNHSETIRLTGDSDRPRRKIHEPAADPPTSTSQRPDDETRYSMRVTGWGRAGSRTSRPAISLRLPQHARAPRGTCTSLGSHSAGDTAGADFRRPPTWFHPILAAKPKRSE